MRAQFLILGAFLIGLYSVPVAAGKAYAVRMAPVDPPGLASEILCAAKDRICSVNVRIPGHGRLEGRRGAIQADILFKNEFAHIAFKGGGDLLSISGQGRDEFLERMEGQKLKRRIRLYRISPAAKRDPVAPSFLVIRPPNKFLMELEVEIERRNTGQPAPR